MHPAILFLLVLVTWVGIASPTASSSAQDPVDFNRDIRPLLSDRCYLCHGPDQGTNQSGVRLDLEQAALDAGAWINDWQTNSKQHWHVRCASGLLSSIAEVRC